VRPLVRVHLLSEIYRHNNPDEVCYLLTMAEEQEPSLETLEAANALLTPLIDYMRVCRRMMTRPLKLNMQSNTVHERGKVSFAWNVLENNSAVKMAWKTEHASELDFSRKSAFRGVWSCFGECAHSIAFCIVYIIIAYWLNQPPN